VNRYFQLWGWDSALDRIRDALYENCRELLGCEASPTAAITDSQNVKSAEKGNGFDPGKKIKGKKRHILVHTQGLLLSALVHSSGVQVRDGGISLLEMLYDRLLFLKTLFADSA